MKTIVVNWKNLNRYHKHWIEHHKLRKEIFVNRLGWDLASYDDMEFDEFDTPPAHYVLCVDDEDRVCGVSRLMSTVNPYMIQKIWPDWLQGPLPKSEKIWEATRFGVSARLNAEDRKRAIDLITDRIYTYGQENGVESFLLVMPTYIYDRILIPRGYDLELMSNVKRIDGLRTAIARVDVESGAPDCAGIPLAADIAPPTPKLYAN